MHLFTSRRRASHAASLGSCDGARLAFLLGETRIKVDIDFVCERGRQEPVGQPMKLRNLG